MPFINNITVKMAPLVGEANRDKTLIMRELPLRTRVEDIINFFNAKDDLKLENKNVHVE